MIFFPNTKINLGLSILRKRSDGYHDIETLLYPIGLSDAIEFLPSPERSGHEQTILNTSGFALEDRSGNLCIEAYELLKSEYNLPDIQLHIHKNIPIGAGLGGGSSNAAFMLKALNKAFDLNISSQNLKSYAAKLGSDCPFFLWNKPAIVRGKGDKLYPVSLNLSHLYLVVIYPGFPINSAEAYSLCNPCEKEYSIESIIADPVETWKYKMYNQFEEFLFPKYQLLKDIKHRLYKNGAIYASITGSGSAVYGLFRKEVNASMIFDKFFVWQEVLS